jgi:transcriptional regulator with XRE-family HTH domain
MSFGSNIQRIRELKGWSVEDLAERMGIGKAGIYKWEADETKPGLESLIDLSRALDTTIDELVNENLTPVEKPSDNNGIEIGADLKALIEKNDRYQIIPTIILNDYEILSKHELQSRERTLEAMLDLAREMSATKQVIINDKNKLIASMEAEIADLEEKLKAAASPQETQK